MPDSSGVGYRPPLQAPTKSAPQEPRHRFPSLRAEGKLK